MHLRRTIEILRTRPLLLCTVLGLLVALLAWTLASPVGLVITMILFGGAWWANRALAADRGSEGPRGG